MNRCGGHRRKETGTLSLRSRAYTRARAYYVWSRTCACACHQLSAAASLTSHRSPRCQRVSRTRPGRTRARLRTFHTTGSTAASRRARRDVTLRRLRVLGAVLSLRSLIANLIPSSIPRRIGKLGGCKSTTQFCLAIMFSAPR